MGQERPQRPRDHQGTSDRNLLQPSEPLLLPFLGLDGVKDGLPLGLVPLAHLLDLLLHLWVQGGQTEMELLHRPGAHLQRPHLY